MSDAADPRALDALRREREAEPPDGARERVASKLGLVLPLAPATGGASPGPGAHAATSGARAVAAAGEGASVRGAHAVALAGTRSLALLGAVFVGGAGVGVALHAAFVHPPAPRIVYVQAPGAPIASAPARVVPAVVAEAAATAVAEAVDPETLPRAASPAAASTPPPAPGQLDSERALLDAAHVALVAGDSDTALRALERHARKYPRAMLGEERDALFVQALVHAGRYDEARAHADAFRRHAPGSLFMPAVDAAIASIP
jgi:hypothetical protein